MGRGKWYVGCACDGTFAQHTAVMLTSLALNGDVPEATIIVAGFGLEEEQKTLIRSHAGASPLDIRFIDVGSASPEALTGRTWESHYPPAVIGRLFIPDLIEDKDARLLTLDSDMIVNSSVRPLFELVMDEGYVAAIHDTPRTDDLDYFNSGMMLIDVDVYKRYDVGSRCLNWLTERGQIPRWPDQDALNTIIGHKWHRLPRKWNWAYCGQEYGDKPLSPSDYEDANIAHFTGQGKPWNDDSHPGQLLYTRYRKALFARSQAWKEFKSHVDDNFTATAVELLLGRQVAGLEEIRRLRASDSVSTLARVVQSRDFLENSLLPLVNTSFGSVDDNYNRRFMYWASERLPLAQSSAEMAVKAKSRSELLRVVINDDVFRRMVGIDNLIRLSDIKLGTPNTGTSGATA